MDQMTAKEIWNQLPEQTRQEIRKIVLEEQTPELNYLEAIAIELNTQNKILRKIAGN